ncbi:MAG: DUF2971 domain-containing protein [Azospirillaceae bacterium]|nr:DUF2971 domain-containing protein [Azospirillaceae bacterium]
MVRRFYRFRSVDALLGKRAELDSQEIYFASPAELNDPMEGFKDLYWQGDEIVWRNLIRHYALCLLNTVMTIIFLGADFNKSRHCQFAHHTEADLPSDEARKIYADICEKLFAHEVVGELIAMLATTSAKVRRDELGLYLRALNPLVFTLAKAALAIPPVDIGGDAAGQAIATDQLKSLGDMIRQRADHAELAEPIFDIGAITTMQIALIYDFNNTLTPTQKAWSFLAREFGDFYIRSLESLVHSDWYAACFLDDASNASMWGNYADGHKGMCLTFSANVTPSGDASLSLYQAVGVGGGRGDIRIHYGYSPLPFEAVRYGDDYPEISFFETLGTVQGERLSFWYAGPEGKRSKSSAQILGNQDEWRTGYWKDYHAGRVTKTRDWAHESEYRLVLGSSISQPRTLKYRFKDLAGICFGIKTSTEDKLRVMRIIEQKCLAERRTDFEFYQARFSHRTKKIELVLLRQLKVTLGPADGDGPATAPTSQNTAVR